MDFIENINHGGFGLVEKMQLDDGSYVAKKIFNPSVPIKSNDDLNKLLKRFEREVKYTWPLMIGI